MRCASLFASMFMGLALAVPTIPIIFTPVKRSSNIEKRVSILLRLKGDSANRTRNQTVQPVSTGLLATTVEKFNSQWSDSHILVSL
jgi:hypothetical protein